MIYACISGEGPITVILAAGAGQTSRTWQGVSPRLANHARVISFDRPGLGQSPPGATPRTPTRIATELQALLDVLEVRGPLVLVGHSMGGVHVLRFAELYPERVSSLVLLDTPPPDFEETRMGLLDSSEQAERRRLLAEGLDRMPETARLEREGAADESAWSFPAFPRSTPLTVIVADAQDFGRQGSPEAHRRAWLEGVDAWVEISDMGRKVVASGSGHMVHHDRSDLVVEEILKMVRAAGR